MIDGVSQVSMNVSVNDLERSKKFWIEAIGFELVSDQEMGNERWIRVTPPHHNVVLVLGGPNPFLAEFQRNLPTQLPNSPVFFACDDIVKTHKELVARGVQFAQTPIKMPFGWWALFCDPEGNRFALNQREP
jgi:predicted enzyme related to lactoylglutathione lyase